MPFALAPSTCLRQKDASSTWVATRLHSPTVFPLLLRSHLHFYSFRFFLSFTVYYQCTTNSHMPCAFYAPKVMTIHADLAFRHAQLLASTGDSKVPCIVAGDFNIKPVDSIYTLLTTGQLATTDDFFPTPKNGFDWKVSLEPMRSAYADVLGSEPDFTNYARVKEDEPFIDTLDYIFVSSEWKVDSVLELPGRNAVKGPFPNLDENEPSDHVLIAATLELVESK